MARRSPTTSHKQTRAQPAAKEQPLWKAHPPPPPLSLPLSQFYGWAWHDIPWNIPLASSEGAVRAEWEEESLEPVQGVFTNNQNIRV